jgi:hypothetical protein
LFSETQWRREEPQLRLKNIWLKTFNDEVDCWIPFHSDIPVFRKKYYLVKLMDGSVLIDDVIHEFRK